MNDHDVWLAVFCAVAACHNSNGDTARRWADRAVKEFRDRFPACSRCSQIHREGEACPRQMEGFRT